MLFDTVPTQTPIQPLRYTDSPVTTPTDTETPPLPTSLCSYHRSFQLDPAPLHTNVAPCSSTGLMQLGRISMVLAREKCDAGVSLISPFSGSIMLSFDSWTTHTLFSSLSSLGTSPYPE